jgi:hypothetical protein
MQKLLSTQQKHKHHKQKGYIEEEKGGKIYVGVPRIQS